MTRASGNARPEFLNNLQGLRGYAAANVILIHLALMYHATPPFGLYGVDLFFVLSGFLMARIAAQDPSFFLTRRIIRIVPLYWLCTLGIYLVATLQPGWLHSTRPDPANLLKSLFFIPYRKESGAIQPLLFLGWTLNYEMFFYLVFALVLKLRRRNPAWFAAAVLIVLAVLGRVLAPQSVPLSFCSQPIILEFVLGILVCQLASRAGSVKIGAAWPAGLLLVCLCSLPVVERINGLANREFLLGLPAAGVVFSAVLLEQRGWRVDNRFLLMTGNASYALYLTHPYVLQAAEKLLRPDRWHWDVADVFSALVLSGVCLLVAVGAHLFVELPLMRALKRLVPLPRGDRAVATTPAPAVASL